MRKIILWFSALALLALGLGTGWIGSAWSETVRWAASGVLWTLAFLVLSVGFIPVILRRTTRAEDYQGGCPVGATCPCGHFNFKPRKTCRQCGADTDYETPPKPGADSP